MAFIGHKPYFQFFKNYVKQSTRMYQTIRVIRPQPKGRPDIATVIKGRFPIEHKIQIKYIGYYI